MGAWAAKVVVPGGIVVRLGSDGGSIVDEVVVGECAAGVLSLSLASRIFVALEPGLRQSFNRLQARVQSVLEQDPLSGHLFLFTSSSQSAQTAAVGWLGAVDLRQVTVFTLHLFRFDLRALMPSLF
jgi:hypothetical protein